MAGKSAQSNPCVNWCFTINNYKEKHIDELRALYKEETLDDARNGIAKYIVFGKEVCKSGTPHLQGFMQLYKKQRFTSLKKLNVFKLAHLEAAKGTPEQAAIYCKKDNEFVELGELTRARSLDTLRTKINACSTWTEVLDIQGIEKHINYARECWAHRKPEKMEGVVLRGWQQELYDVLVQPADDRTIIWVLDDKGGKGKTFFCKYMMSNYGAFYCSPAKQADILCLYDNQPIVLYDIPRCVDEEYVNYGVLEKIKDGIVFSGKYCPITKIRKQNAHVVVFSNFPCEVGKFSEDRLKVIDLNPPKTPEPVPEPEPEEQTKPDDGGGAQTAPPHPLQGGAAKRRHHRRKPFTTIQCGAAILTIDKAVPAVSGSITRNCGTMALSAAADEKNI